MTKFEKNDQMQKIRKQLKPYQDDATIVAPEKIKDTEAVYQALSTEGKNNKQKTETFSRSFFKSKKVSSK